MGTVPSRRIETEGEAREPDKAASTKSSRRSPSPRLVGVGRALLSGEVTLGAAMKRAGYSEASAKSPALHGISYSTAVRAALEADPRIEESLGIDSVTLSALHAAAERITDRTASDALLAVLIRYRQERELEEDPPIISLQLATAEMEVVWCESRILGAEHPEDLEKFRRDLAQAKSDVERELLLEPERQRRPRSLVSVDPLPEIGEKWTK